MSKCTKNSDRDCCRTCNHLGYLVELHHTSCLATRKATNEWDDACDLFSRVFQGFGE